MTRAVVIVSVMLMAVGIVSGARVRDAGGLPHERFESWAAQHGKSYANEEERRARLVTWMQTDREIAAHNANESRTFEMGHNAFSDMSWSEFSEKVLMTNPLGASQNCSATAEESSSFGHDIELSSAPKFIDWREYEAVSEVKNQGQCGSCWTFSSTGALESHHFLATGDMVLLSEQQLVDCAGAFDTHGCGGGLPSKAFEYVHYNRGIDTESAYPYKAENEKCSFDADAVGARVHRTHNITFQDEAQLVKAIGFKGPVSIAYQVASDFKQYKSGVYSSSICKNGPETVNHAVLAVGYALMDVVDSLHGYYIVKNSWGTSWGMAGFFEIELGKNMCGLADCASFPEVK